MAATYIGVFYDGTGYNSAGAYPTSVSNGALTQTGSYGGGAGAHVQIYTVTGGGPYTDMVQYSLTTTNTLIQFWFTTGQLTAAVKTALVSSLSAVAICAPGREVRQ